MPPARGSCQQPRQAGACSPAAPPSDRLRDVKQPCRAHRSDLAGVRDPRPRRAHQGESSTTRAKRATERTNLRKMRPRRRFAAGSRSKARGGSAPHILRFWGKSVRSKFLLRHSTNKYLPVKDRELVSDPMNRSARNGQNTKSFNMPRLLTTARGCHGAFTPAHGISQNRPKQSGLTIDILFYNRVDGYLYALPGVLTTYAPSFS